MINLPIWTLTLCDPLYDTSSKSPMEMTAQVYGKVRELVEAFNKLSTDLTKALEDFTYKSINDQQEFENHINHIMNEYITSIDCKINEIKENISSIIAEEVKQGIIAYNEESEELVVGGVS